VQCWGTSPIGVPGIPGLAISIAAGDISCAILSDNTVACWSTCGSTAALVSGLTAKSLALVGQLCAVLMDGSVKCGSTWTALLQSSAILTGVAQVANNPDQDFTCALKTDGTVWCWGNNGEGELGTGSGLPSSSATPLPTGINNAVTVSTGGATDDSDDHACVLLSTGGVECWGGNFDGAIGNGTTGATVPTPYPITSLASAISVAAGDDFSCAVLSTGSAACWGANYEGMLGNGTLAPSPSPGAVLYVTNAKAIAARTWEACVLNNDGSVQCWGTLLGNGSTATSTATPVYVSGI